MKVQFRIYGAYIFIIIMLVLMVVIFMQENWQEVWAGLVFLGAFCIGMVIYIKSNMTEKTRLQNEKAKKKGKTNQHHKGDKK